MIGSSIAPVTVRRNLSRNSMVDPLDLAAYWSLDLAPFWIWIVWMLALFWVVPKGSGDFT